MRLGDLLRPIDEETFFGSIVGQEYKFFAGPISHRFDSLFGWNEINSLLSDYPLPSPYLRLLGTTGEVPEAEYKRVAHGPGDSKEIVPAKLYSLMSAGATLIIDAIDQMHGQTRAFARGLDGNLGERVQVNVFASLNGAPGFKPHWDDVDVIVMQIDGRKRWRIYGPARRFPLYRDSESNLVPPEACIAEFDIGPGQVLYIPRGWWHAVSTPSDSPSLHLAIGISRRTAIDFMIWLTDQLRANETFRQDLRRPTGESSGKKELAQLREGINDVLARPDILHAYFADEDSLALTRPEFDLPLAASTIRSNISNAKSVIWLAPRARIHDGPEITSVVADGRRWRFSIQVRSLLDAMMTRREVLLGELRRMGKEANLDPSTIDTFILELAHSGLVSFTRPKA